MPCTCDYDHFSDDEHRPDCGIRAIATVTASDPAAAVERSARDACYWCIVAASSPERAPTASRSNRDDGEWAHELKAIGQHISCRASAIRERAYKEAHP